MSTPSAFDIESKPQRSASANSAGEARASEGAAPQEFYDMSSLHRLNVFRAGPSKQLFMDLRASEKTIAILELELDVLSQIFESLNQIDRASVLHDVSLGALERLFPLLTEEERVIWRRTTTHERNTVGSIMVPAVHSTVACSWTLRELTAAAPDAWLGTVHALYAIDDDQKYLGAIDLMHVINFVAQNPQGFDARVADLRLLAVPTVTVDEELVNAATLIEAHRSLHILPVVDGQGCLVGLLPATAVLRHLVQLEKINAQALHLTPLEGSYSKSSVAILIRKRAPWLLGLIAVNLGSAAVIAENEAALERRMILAAFIPLLIDTGGNTGSQVATLVISALASNDIELSDWLLVLRRELLGSLALAAILGFGGWVLGFLFSHEDANIGFIVGFAMAAIVVSANLVGSVLPFLATIFKVDPAVVCSPMITTVVDITGILIYFALATMFG